MEEIEILRKQIDKIDADWMRLLSERFKVTATIGTIKARDGIASVDSGREALQMEKIQTLAASIGLDPTLAKDILRLIIDEVVRDHRRIANS